MARASHTWLSCLVSCVALAACTRNRADCADLLLDGSAIVVAPATSSVPLDTPRTATGGDVQTVASLTMTVDGTTSLDGRALAGDDALRAALREAVGKNPELRLVIKAESKVTHGEVIHALDLAKQAGIGRIAFGVTPTAPSPTDAK